MCFDLQITHLQTSMENMSYVKTDAVVKLLFLESGRICTTVAKSRVFGAQWQSEEGQRGADRPRHQSGGSSKNGGD